MEDNRGGWLGVWIQLDVATLIVNTISGNLAGRARRNQVDKS